MVLNKYVSVSNKKIAHYRDLIHPNLQSGTELAETNAMSAYFEFSCIETPTRWQKCYPSPYPHSMLFERTDI